MPNPPTPASPQPAPRVEDDGVPWCVEACLLYGTNGYCGPTAHERICLPAVRALAARVAAAPTNIEVERAREALDAALAPKEPTP